MRRRMPPTNKSPARADSRSPLWIAALIVAVVATYANSFWGIFLLDDTRAIVENSRIQELWPLGPILSGPRPVVDLSLAVNYAISGVRPWSYHAVNLLIHLFATLTLFGLVRRTVLRINSERLKVGATPIAFATAILWAIHPLQTQAVTYVIQRSESMMAMFYLLTLYCFARGAIENRREWYAAAVVACALGMGSKAVMITAPVVVLLYDRAFVASRWREIWEHRWGVHLA